MTDFFYIRKINQNPVSPVIDSIEGYYTDEGHTMYFPTRKITREEAIRMIRNGTILFFRNVNSKRTFIHLFKAKNQEFLKIEENDIPADFFEDKPI